MAGGWLLATIIASFVPEQKKKSENIPTIQQTEETDIKRALQPVESFTAPDGETQYYRYDGIVYATKEQAEAIRAEKTILIVDGIRYATREQADEARERSARTVNGVVYSTIELAEQVREQSNLESSIRNSEEWRQFIESNRALASNTNSNYKEMYLRHSKDTIDNWLNWASEKDLKEAALKVEAFISARQSPPAFSQTLLGKINEKLEEKDKAKRTYNGVLYNTFAEAEKVKQSQITAQNRKKFFGTAE